jgi:peptidoglycan/LPS O-acetylase OafA/YrhL
MLQLSYWLFPMLFLVFLVSVSQAFLLPGLVAACAAGAANSAVVQNYPSAVAHGLAAALCIFLFCRPRKCACRARDADALERFSAVLAWSLLALVACYVISDSSWPYSLSKPQMLVVFLPFLVVGAAVRRSPG